MANVTVLCGRERRRRWSTAEKLRLVAESLSAGLSVAEFARRHDVHPNLVHAWRRQAQAGELSVAPDGEARPFVCAGQCVYRCPWRASTIASATRGAIGCGQRLPAASRMPMPTAMTRSIICTVSGLSRRSIGPHGPAIAAAFGAPASPRSAAANIFVPDDVGNISDGASLVRSLRTPTRDAANTISSIFRTAK
jgi:Transposase